jgi:hypothetical protein
MKQIEGQMTLEGCSDIKPLIYSLSMNWWRTICPYCKMDNPDSTEMNNCTKRLYKNKNLPFFDLPLNFCPNCGKEFDTNCEVRMTKDFEKNSPVFVAKLVKDEKGRWRER